MTTIQEEIPSKYYPLLNEYILRGKRTYLQQTRLGSSLSSRKAKLRHELCIALEKVESPHFKIELYRPTSGLYYEDARLRLVSKHADGSHVWTINFNVSTLSEMFFYVDIWVERHQSQVQEYFSHEFSFEYPEVVKDLKKAAAFLFFEYRAVSHRFSEYQRLIKRRLEKQRFLYEKIREMWEKDFPCKVGTEVRYADIRSSIDRNRVGVVTRIEVHSGRYYYYHIKSDKGRMICRRSWEISWKNKFAQTTLDAQMNLLDSCIPECWSEKRLDYYV